jgi:hypothetical protein
LTRPSEGQVAAVLIVCCLALCMYVSCSIHVCVHGVFAVRKPAQQRPGAGAL